MTIQSKMEPQEPEHLTIEQYEHRLDRQHMVNADAARLCECGKSASVTPCSECEFRVYSPTQRILDFVEGKDANLDPDLLMAMGQWTARIPVLEQRLVEATDRIDKLEGQQEPRWVVWLNRFSLVGTLLGWLKPLFGFFRRTSKHTKQREGVQP